MAFHQLILVSLSAMSAAMVVRDLKDFIYSMLISSIPKRFYFYSVLIHYTKGRTDVYIKFNCIFKFYESWCLKHNDKVR